MTEQANDAPTHYRIGAVSRMTGISADALRIWERRYAAVSPQRSPGGGRLYSPQDLARLRLIQQLAALFSAVKCECPKHLAELIASLSGFERYGAECESRSPRDAALHASLHATASQARHMIEGALDHVIEIEDIKL